MPPEALTKTHRWLLIGEAPNKVVEKHPHLWLLPDRSGLKHSANRLLYYTGWNQNEFVDIFVRTNLIHRAVPENFNFGGSEAREGARLACEQLLNANRLGTAVSCKGIVLLGKNVARAFKFYDRETREPIKYAKIAYLEEMITSSEPQSDDLPVIVIPHPSGRCLWWNEESNRVRAREFFTRLKRESFKL